MDLSRNVANRREFTTFSRNSKASRILVAFSLRASVMGYIYSLLTQLSVEPSSVPLEQTVLAKSLSILLHSPGFLSLRL